MPGQGELLLPPCRGDESVGTALAAGSGSIFGSKSFCLGWERAVALADHTGEEFDWRIVFYHVDHLGTPRVLTDEFGAVISKHALLPFGEEVPAPAGTGWTIANSTNTHWFTGHERDTATGSDFLLARHYSVNSARFRQRDPSHSNVSFTQDGSWHAYAYVNASPLAFVDPMGLAALVTRGIDIGLDCPLNVVSALGGGPPFSGIDALHPVFLYDDGRTSSFRPDGTVGPDDPAFKDDYRVLIDRLDDRVLDRSEERVKGKFEGRYSGLYRNCQSYANSVLQKYNSLVGEAKRLLEECRNKDATACKLLEKRCKNGGAPSDTCMLYEEEKKSGLLPAHRLLQILGQ